ncbi:MAG: hypothetical protein GQ583_09885 [Methyloprofundus sp.]|nr:hypothetical protein [Methyloprofundus sp.]
MNRSAHFFDPALERLYTEQLTNSSNTAELRHLFYQLNQSGQTHNIMPRAYGFIQHQLKQTEKIYAAEIIQDYTLDQPALLQVAPISPLAQQHWTQDNVHSWVKQTTAVLLTQACWLQNISPAAASQTLISRQLISLYLQLTRKTQQGVSLPQAYQAMLLTQGIKIPSLHSHSFSQQPELMPDVLNFATLQLALSRFPRVLLAEILGFTLAYCQMPTLIETCFPKHLTSELFFQQHQSLLQQQISPLLQCITAYLDLFPQHIQALWRRIQNGFWLYQLQMQRSKTQFSNTLNSSLPSQHAVAKLLQQKAVAAIGHHHKIQLQGKPLDLWFSGLPENTQEFLHALIQSKYVDRQNPANSHILKLFAFKGPMFGVLNKSEQQSLLNWLQDGLNMSASCIVENVAAATTVQSSKHKQVLKNYAKFSNRELYYYLVNVDLFPDILATAKAKVSKLLRTCALFNPLPFKHYSHQQFDAYIGNIYQQEIITYKPLQGAPKISKAAYIWGFEQIAPLILIDGCWIQNSLALKNINPEICEILFSIYADEIGCGQLQQNHPFIFQQLLDNLAIHLPPVHSREFSQHPGFLKSAFDLPVYMLSLSSFSVEFLPELLGLNMAIELSGLGKSYMRLVDDWNYWGIDPSIASIHISIDNYASGHTYLAKKAIQIYMDELMQTTGNHILLDKHWRRIYSGYASLRFVGGRFKFGLPIWYFIHKFKRRHGLVGSRS